MKDTSGRKKIFQYIELGTARFVFGCLFAVAAFTICYLAYHKLNAGVLFAALFFASSMIHIQEETVSHKKLLLLYAVWTGSSACLTLFLSQLCMNEGLPERGIYADILGVLLIIGLYLLLYALSGKIRSGTIALSIVLVLFSCLNYFVFLFRGSEIAPADILSITAAGNVAAEYAVRIPAPMLYALMMTGVYAFSSFSLPPFMPNHSIKARSICALLALVGFISIWFCGSTIQPLHFLQTGSVENGFFLNFTLLLRETFPVEPQDYSVDEVNRIAKNYSVLEAETLNDKQPDIIVVMDESFADLNILGKELSTDIEVTPFINSLKKNTLRGYTLSSVFGGGTPNSEYEFLTGNTFLFLPTGSIAYQQFIKEPCYSMAQELKSRGYTTIAMHQYLSNSWMRSKNWPLLGFDKCLFMEDFPQNNMLRAWGTDQEMFETMAKQYEEHKDKSDTPVFIFAVTIQNHGGFYYSGSDFTTTVHLQGYSRKYPDVEQYLTCVNKTDYAVQWLIEYFNRVDREVVILFFGDHYPKLDNAFFEEVHGGKYETLDEQMLQYKVPFFIWTNYQSEYDEVNLISMNYLSGLLYQRAGLEMPCYNQFLENMRQMIPACNSQGYYSNSFGGFRELKEAQGQEKDALLEYNWVEWNGMFDKKNKNPIFFSVF